MRRLRNHLPPHKARVPGAVVGKVVEIDLGPGRPSTLILLLRTTLLLPYFGNGLCLSKAGRDPTFHRPPEAAVGRQALSMTPIRLGLGGLAVS
jgi:hypothetical protein